MGVPEGAEREAGFKYIFNEIIIFKNFPNMEKTWETTFRRGTELNY